MNVVRGALVWTALAAVIAAALGAAASSPLLAWRDPIYIVAGFAGVCGMALLLLQPLLAAGLLAGLSDARARQLHRIVGGTLLLAVFIHVGGLWITSPPDVIDALLLVSATPFSIWGVIAMWGVFATATLALLRRRLRLRPSLWRRSHKLLAVVIAPGSVIHALMIDGTMERWSRGLLCGAVLVATALAISRRRNRKHQPGQ